MKEHPEDRKMRIEGQRYGKAFAEEFVDAHRRKVVALIATYPDSKASDLLDRLRELFWSEIWKPKSNRRKPRRDGGGE